MFYIKGNLSAQIAKRSELSDLDILQIIMTLDNKLLDFMGQFMGW